MKLIFCPFYNVVRSQATGICKLIDTRSCYGRGVDFKVGKQKNDDAYGFIAYELIKTRLLDS